MQSGEEELVSLVELAKVCEGGYAFLHRILEGLVEGAGVVGS